MVFLLIIHNLYIYIDIFRYHQRSTGVIHQLLWSMLWRKWEKLGSASRQQPGNLGFLSLHYDTNSAVESTQKQPVPAPNPFCPWKKNTTLFSTLSLCLNAAMATAEQRWLTWQHHMSSTLAREIRITLWHSSGSVGSCPVGLNSEC